MTAPALQRYAQGQGTVSADNLNTMVQSCNLASELYAFIGTDGMQVYLRGINAVDDGGAGNFYWNASGTADDGINNILPNGSALGCWTRLTQAIGSGTVMLSGSSLTITADEETVVVNKTTGSATTIMLPADPFIWEGHEIVDGKGDAASNNITINGNGNNINGASTLVISTNYQTKIVRFNGTQWNIISAS